MRYTGVGMRAVASAIDMAVVVAIGYGIAKAAGTTTSTGFELSGASFFAWVAVSFAYYVGAEAACGATLGKRVMGLKVVGEDGSPIGPPAAVIRNLLRPLDVLFFLVGVILIWSSPKRQRLGDRAAGSVVVRGSSLAVPAAAVR